MTKDRKIVAHAESVSHEPLRVWIITLGISALLLAAMYLLANTHGSGLHVSSADGMITDLLRPNMI
jgi:hypothetical protein